METMKEESYLNAIADLTNEIHDLKEENKTLETKLEELIHDLETIGGYIRDSLRNV